MSCSNSGKHDITKFSFNLTVGSATEMPKNLNMKIYQIVVFMSFHHIITASLLPHALRCVCIFVTHRLTHPPQSLLRTSCTFNFPNIVDILCAWILGWAFKVLSTLLNTLDFKWNSKAFHMVLCPPGYLTTFSAQRRYSITHPLGANLYFYIVATLKHLKKLYACAFF